MSGFANAALFIHEHRDAILIGVILVSLIMFIILFYFQEVYTKNPIAAAMLHIGAVLLPITIWYFTREKHSVSDTIEMIESVLKRDDISEDKKAEYRRALETLEMLPSNYSAE